MKDRYGIPCRHLFAVEPMYTLLDIHCRWQVKYAHHFYTEGSGNITKAYKARIILEHNGIQQKEKNTILNQQRTSKFSKIYKCDNMDVLNRIMQIYEGEIPTCWNYRFEEYPINYQVKASQRTVEAQPFSQEFVGTNLDSDGEYKEDEVYDRRIIKRNEGKSHDISDSKIIQKLKSMLYLFPSVIDKTELYDCLATTANAKYSEKLNLVPPSDHNVDVRFVSSHLPLDKSKESTQHTYTYERSVRKSKRKKIN